MCGAPFPEAQSAARLYSSAAPDVAAPDCASLQATVHLGVHLIDVCTGSLMGCLFGMA